MKKQRKTVKWADNALAKRIKLLGRGSPGDNPVKEVFRSKPVLAHVIRSLVPELRSVSYEDLAEHYIEALDERLVAPHKRSLISGKNIESREEGEANLYFDVRFNVTLPERSQERYELHVDLESQKTMYPGYSLPKRMVYYLARLISEQIETLNKAENYNLLQPVCSIWICYDRTPKASKGSILTLALSEVEPMYGTPKFSAKDFDFGRIIVVTVPEEKDENHALEVLRNLLGKGLNADERIDNLKELGLPLTEEFEEEVRNMTGYIEGYGEDCYDRGHEEGLKKGLKKGREEAALEIAMSLKGDMPDERIAEKTGFPLERIKAL